MPQYYEENIEVYFDNGESSSSRTNQLPINTTSHHYQPPPPPIDSISHSKYDIENLSNHSTRTSMVRNAIANAWSSTRKLGTGAGVIDNNDDTLVQVPPSPQRLHSLSAFMSQSVLCWSPASVFNHPHTDEITRQAEEGSVGHRRSRSESRRSYRTVDFNQSTQNDYDNDDDGDDLDDEDEYESNNNDNRNIRRLQTALTTQTTGLSCTSSNSDLDDYDDEEMFFSDRRGGNKRGAALKGGRGAAMAARKTDPNTAPLVWATKHLLKPNGSILGKDVATTTLPQFPDLLSCIPFVDANTTSSGKVRKHHRPAIASIDNRAPISHRRIYDFIVDVGHILHDRVRVGRGHRIAVVLPNGSELALAILAVTCWASCVPLNAFAAPDELEADLLKSGADCVIGLDPIHAGSGHAIQQLAFKLQIPFVGLVPDKNFAALFELYPPPVQSSTFAGQKVWFLPNKANRYPKESGINRRMPNQHNDEILVLFTSGTTGNKKLVPHLLSDVLIATACISVSWDLTPNDTNCNLMPLFHVGGIIRQVFSPVLSGGCVICCPSFDPIIFWKLLMKNMKKSSDGTIPEPFFTWYYAAPTMHQLILQTGRDEGYIPNYDPTKEGRPFHEIRHPEQPKLKMIANAAGGLLPSLARELRQAFGAYVLPSYGMTECMPISSPPSTYQLERPGTSGVAVGPELAIMNKVTLQPLRPGEEGPICVRSEPCFRGYGTLLDEASLAKNEEKPVTFIPHPRTGQSSGWFDTGDLGYMDADGYLYITGRSKEVINRGGEIISPMEVEDAVIGHPDVEACAAISTPHAVLQEVVGLVLVPKAGRPRIDLRQLQEYLGDGRLAAPKWPQCLVYMSGGLPKSFTNKLLRVGLGKRLNLPELTDEMTLLERTFEAKCPPQGTDLSVPIPCKNVRVNAAKVQATLQKELVSDPNLQTLLVSEHPTKPNTLVAHVYNLERVEVINKARTVLDGYSVPTHICLLSSLVHTSPKFLAPPQSSDAIGSILQQDKKGDSGSTSNANDQVVTQVQELFQLMLKLDCLPEPTVSFFNLGGSSMVASQLASKVRKLFNIAFGGAEVFQHSTCYAIASLVHERRGTSATTSSNNNSESDTDPLISKKKSCRKIVETSDLPSTPGKDGSSSNTRKPPFDKHRIDIEQGWLGTIFQIIPLLVIYPLWQLTRVFLFFFSLIAVLTHTEDQNVILKFIITLFVFHFTWVTLTPLFFVMCKWLIIGQYKPGRYPIWGSYYMRWWFVDILRKLTGRGTWGFCDFTLNLYYWLLGANIGYGARISSAADIAEYDLVTIGAGASVEISTIRAFGVDNGAMILGPVSVGVNSSVGARSVVAPFTSIPDETHLGPLTNSYELSNTANDDTSKHIMYNRQAFAEPNFLSQLFVISPIMFLVNSLSRLPGWAIVYWMLVQPWNYEEPYRSIETMLEWLSDPRRISFYIGIRIAHSIIAPIIYMACAIVVKRCIIGKFRPGPRSTDSQWQLIRHALAAKLLSRERMQNVTELVGRHYELVSILYRLLGAKVGKRVFWPGRQPIFTGEFDLLEIGDDVVFGSRTCLICTTTSSAEKIILCAGANVSDNAIVLPGSIVGKGAVLASNTICPAGRYIPEASVWLGTKNGHPVMLEQGVEEYNGPAFACDVNPKKIQMIGDETTIKPFGNAFYRRKANYFVLPLAFIIPYTLFIRIVSALLISLPVIGAIHGTTGVYYGWPIAARDYSSPRYSLTTTLFPLLFACYVITHFIHTVLWVLIEVISKWGLMGRRQVGRFNYDTSSYGQRWELYQIMSKCRDLGRLSFLDFICGTPYIVWFFRLLGCNIGRNCCLFPTGGDPYLTEPDLVTIGDNCVIDAAAIICHLNTRGNFQLSNIVLENNVTLRARSRIQQAVVMEEGSMLLEKSLAMTGEIVEAESVWLGNPSSRLFNYDNSTVSSGSPQSSLEDGPTAYGSSPDPGEYI